MKRISKLSVGAAVIVTGVLFAGSAMAQEAAAGGTAGGEVGMTLPGAGGGPKAEAAAGDSDHDMMIGHFGVGYLGRTTIPLDGGDLQAPIVGLRYWLDEMIGIDAGLGFFNDGGKSTANNVSTDFASRLGFAVHAGVPLALAGGKHFSFQVVPELNVGFASQDEKDIANGAQVQGAETKHSGNFVQVGARVGGEVQFGFMGIPQLSLQAGVGLLYTQEVRHREVSQPNQPTITTETSQFHVSTTVDGQPWDIFTGNIAALYYF
jgi:hypothetical protein